MPSESYSLAEHVSSHDGALIGGRYRLEHSIGSGGMGEVFRAVDTLLGRPVAVKLVRSVEPGRRKEVAEAFLREARISAAIAHPSVVQILDFGLHDEQAPFIVMELLTGENLADMLDRGVSFSLSFVLELMLRVLDALRAAHAAGIVHRDIKPENIFLTRQQHGMNPKLLDFGISKILDSRGLARVTVTQGHVIGTPAYMSPEQARGLKEIDQRADIYSVGVVLYELLSGELPFFSENPGDLLMMIMASPELPLAARVPELTGAVSDLVSRAMAKEPEQRFRDAGEMLAALRAVQVGLEGTGVDPVARSVRSTALTAATTQPTLAPLSATLPLAAEPPSTLRKRLGLLGVALVAATLGAGAFIWRGSRGAEPQATRFIVVQADPRTQPGPIAATAAPTPPSPPTQRFDEAPEARVPTERKRALTREETLARDFRAQRAPLVQCVNTFPSVLERHPTLTLRLTLSAAGKVQQVRVSPDDVARSALSGCIEQAARTLRFAKQDSAIVFDVPLTARKEP